MTADAPTKPTISEKVAVASNTSNLSLTDFMHRTQIDYVHAVGMVSGRTYALRLGAALVRLMADWDTCSKPPKRTDSEIAVRAAVLKDKKGRPDFKRARAEAISWYAAALRERYMKLRGRTEVIGLLTHWAESEGIDPDLVSTTVYHWLDPNCGVCSGHGQLKHPEAPVLAVRCWHCKGEGKWPTPFGGLRIKNHMAMCLRLAGQEEMRVLR